MSIKKAIATQIIKKRLGLDGDWYDPEFSIELPTSLVLPTDRELPPGDLTDVKAGVRNLEKMGCQKTYCIGAYRS